MWKKYIRCLSRKQFCDYLKIRRYRKHPEGGAFYDAPMPSSKQLKEITGLTAPTIDSAIRGLAEKDILKEITGFNKIECTLFTNMLKYLLRINKENKENL